MRKKYNIRKKKKTLGTMYIFIIMLTILISISIGYSKFSSNLNIIGKVSIKKIENEGDLGTEFPTGMSNSTANWMLHDSWPHNSGRAYRVTLYITNLDEDLTEWEVIMDVPKGVIKEQINAWSSSETKVTTIGNYDRISQKSFSWNGNVSNGQTIELGFIVYFTEEVEFDIINLLINNKLITDIEQVEATT